MVNFWNISHSLIAWMGNASAPQKLRKHTPLCPVSMQIQKGGLGFRIALSTGFRCIQVLIHKNECKKEQRS